MTVMHLFWSWTRKTSLWGPFIKYVTLEGEGGPRRCDSLWQGEGCPRACDVTLFKFFSYIWNLKLKVMFSFLLQRMYSDRRGTDKNHPEQNLPNKTFQTRNLRTNPRAIYMYECNTKNWGFQDVWRTLGGSRDVWQCVTGRGGQNWSNIAWRTFWTAPK